ncbi:MAG: hypothetical protein JXB34_11250 [Bacteroidales bacterium]|nr:hypothetical protein [Bacteroidales bacterium]
MKKYLLSLMFAGLMAVVFTSCEKNNEEPPVMPPYESMAIDFSKFSDNTKSAAGINAETTIWNFATASLTVFAWNVVLTGTLVVPVAAFSQAISKTPEYLGNKKWQWKFDASGMANTYHARMTGTIRENDVKWEMYISKTGVNAHDEFLWFEGTSKLDGNSGQWILYHSYALQEAVLQIDWAKAGNEVGSVKYTYIRESDNIDPNQLTNGSNLEYGLGSGTLDAFYNIDYNTRNRADSANLQVNIEWSTTLYNGRIKAEHFFKDNIWHCWDSQGNDVVCE